MRHSGLARSNMRTVAIFAAATGFATLILNRWLVSDLGVYSFGRVWQLYISYADFGFVRRGFVGTLMSGSGANSLFANEYVFAYVTQFLAIVFLAALTAGYCIRNRIDNPLLVFAIAFSPAFLTQAGYATGTLDIFVLLLAVVNILYVRSYLVFSVVILIGTLTHELFIFMLPAQFFALYLTYGSTTSIRSPQYVVPALTAAVVAFVVLFFGQVNMSESDFEQIMRTYLPNAHGQHGLWSGYFEVGTATARSLSEAHYLVAAAKDGRILFVIPVLVYVVLLTLRAREHTSNAKETAFLIFAVTATLFAAFLANDLHRWGGMSANMAILLLLRLVARDGRQVSKWNAALAVCCLFAPFGAAELERPFPLHYFVVEKLWPF